MQTDVSISQKLNLPYDPGIPRIKEIKTQRHLCEYPCKFHSINNSQKVEITLESDNWEVDKHNVMYAHNRLFFRRKKEWSANKSTRLC